MIGIGDTSPVAQQSTGCSKLAAVKDCRDLVANGDCGEFRGLAQEDCVAGGNDKAAGSLR